MRRPPRIVSKSSSKINGKTKDNVLKTRLHESRKETRSLKKDLITWTGEDGSVMGNLDAVSFIDGSFVFSQKETKRKLVLTLCSWVSQFWGALFRLMSSSLMACSSLMSSMPLSTRLTRSLYQQCNLPLALGKVIPFQSIHKQNRN